MGTVTASAATAGPRLSTKAEVVSVTDGDTINVSLHGRTEPVRFIGIDTPEVGTACGVPATEHLGALIAGHAVTLVAAPGREDHDGYGRPLRYIEGAGVDIGRQMIADGFAIARYDSLDGYQTHPRQADYWALAAASPAAC